MQRKRCSLAIFIAFICIPSAVLSCDINYHFECDDGQCIDRSELCDNRYNCDDDSDEALCNCRNGPHCYRNCKENEFQCTSGACIPSAWECDGDFDCADLSDEHSTCTKSSCAPYQFTCDNGACIDARLKCNAKNDCGDNSDETVCQIHPAKSTTAANATDCGDAFRCKDGTCISQVQVCDPSKKKDCPDGSDEGDQCETACSGNQCDHDHKATPSGCQCTCRNGYRLAGDGLTCIDTLECANDPPVCSQLCTEEVGSYSCGCFKEYTMKYDNVTCKSRGNTMSIFFAVGNEIRQFTPARRNLRVVHVETAQITALEGDVATEAFYYSVHNDNSLHQLVVANSSRKTIANVGEATNIALDWITRNVYFFSKAVLPSTDIDLMSGPTEGPKTVAENTKGHLQVCNFVERHCATIAELQHRVTALAVDPMAKFLLYATIEAQAQDVPIVRLHRSGLDGQYAQVIATFNQTITDITVDYRHKHLYVVREATIDRLNYDGGHLMNIVETLMRIKGLNIFEDHLYFLTEAGLTMHKCRLYGNARVCTSFRLSADRTDLFVIMQNSRQTPGLNACVNYNCSHLCVPSDRGASCLCENGNVVDESSDCRK